MTDLSMKHNIDFMREQKRRDNEGAFDLLIYFAFAVFLGFIISTGILTIIILYYGVFK